MRPLHACATHLDGIADGMGGVDQQIEQHLLDGAGEARHPWQVRRQIGDRLGHVFVFVACHGEGGEHRLVEIHRRPFATIGMGEVLHRLHHGPHPLHTFEGLGDGLGDLLAQEVEVDGGDGAVEPGECRAGFFSTAASGGEGQMGLDGAVQVRQGIGEEMEVVADELDRRVDLMGDAGGELAHRLHLLGAIGGRIGGGFRVFHGEPPACGMPWRRRA